MKYGIFFLFSYTSGIKMLRKMLHAIFGISSGVFPTKNTAVKFVYRMINSY